MKDTLLKGIVGVGSPVLGTAVSLLQSVEPYLRVTSLVLGIVVGLATLASIIHKWNK